MLKEFRDFIAKGNVLTLAVGLMLGIAFGAVVTSFTNDIMMQLIAAIGAQPDFSKLTVDLNGTPIRYGAFLTALLSFLLVASVLFLVVKGINRLQRPAEGAPKETEVDLLKQIRDALRAGTPTAIR